ncbi:hypothetical protein RHMOL_Rhmol13G0157500 [Rhododendron molle]|uniref:Uncharacterized protein n=1 Tax=Rhododendron molle TaxID=49168 RepID=A0ACC0L7M4_RHOML|nr:hypothetical protein RHMOL_Rhmol13G0157500 [Rhododendron molle]
MNSLNSGQAQKRQIKRAYRDTDDELLDDVVGSRGGSTAVTAILVDGEKLIVGNVGDSRAILCRNGEAKQITVDHEPLKEKQQVESRGGFVSQMPGNVPRVDGQLAMARAFGDERPKEHITAEPDIFVEAIDANTDSIILASDGLWKVRSPVFLRCFQSLACDVEPRSGHQHQRVDYWLSDAQEASKELIIKGALSRNSRDDISCIVVMFD